MRSVVSVIEGGIRNDAGGLRELVSAMCGVRTMLTLQYSSRDPGLLSCRNSPREPAMPIPAWFCGEGSSGNLGKDASDRAVRAFLSRNIDLIFQKTRDHHKEFHQVCNYKVLLHFGARRGLKCCREL